MVIGAGGILDFDNSVLVTEGDVDLTAAVFDFDGSSSIEVPEGTSLTITVEQMQQLRSDTVLISGSGTVFVTGDGTDADPQDDFNVLQTVGVDLSGVTLMWLIATSALEVTLSTAGGARWRRRAFLSATRCRARRMTT